MPGTTWQETPPMVSYQTWTSIVFAEARRQGLEPGQEQAASLVQVGAVIWNDRKQELNTMTRNEAEVVAMREIDIV